MSPIGSLGGPWRPPGQSWGQQREQGSRHGQGSTQRTHGRIKVAIGGLADNSMSGCRGSRSAWSQSLAGRTCQMPQFTKIILGSPPASRSGPGLLQRGPGGTDSGWCPSQSAGVSPPAARKRAGGMVHASFHRHAWGLGTWALRPRTCREKDDAEAFSKLEFAATREKARVKKRSSVYRRDGWAGRPLSRSNTWYKYLDTSTKRHLGGGSPKIRVCAFLSPCVDAQPVKESLIRAPQSGTDLGKSFRSSAWAEWRRC